MTTTALSDYLQTVEDRGDSTRAVAFFDLDRTLIAGYSIVGLAWERVRHGLTRGEVRDSVDILGHLLRRQHGRTARMRKNRYHRLVDRLSHSLAGVAEETLTRLGEQAYRNGIARSIYSESIALVEAHRRAGHRLVIVTAATRYQVEPIAAALGIDEVCCTGLEVADGRFTGRTLAPLCYGEGKAMAARRVCKRVKASLRHSYFYSDSADDLPLLRAVGHPVAVNASEKLAVHARSKGWPQLDFESRGRPSAEAVVRTMLTLQTVAASTAISAVARKFSAGRISTTNRLTRLVGEVGAGFAGIDLEVEGAEHLKKERPAVFIFNHQSMLDALVLAHMLREDVVALCKREMQRNPFLGALLEQADTIFVDRESRDQSAVLKRALGVLEEGRSLLVAPEGTRSTLGEIQPFKHGAFLLAKKAGVPVVPIVLHNVKDALPNGGLLIRATTIRVTVLPPVHPDRLGGVRRACADVESRYSEVLSGSAIAALPFAAIGAASGINSPQEPR